MIWGETHYFWKHPSIILGENQSHLHTKKGGLRRKISFGAGVRHRAFLGNAGKKWGKITKRLFPCRIHVWYTLQGINISHLGKRKIIFKMPFLGDMLVSWMVYIYIYIHDIIKFHASSWHENWHLWSTIFHPCETQSDEENHCKNSGSSTETVKTHQVRKQKGESFMVDHCIPSLKLTVLHLIMNGWNISFSLGWPIFRCYVSLKQGNSNQLKNQQYMQNNKQKMVCFSDNVQIKNYTDVTLEEISYPTSWNIDDNKTYV